ncbi:choice-of-anchor K domain-containing protein [Leptothoe sp. PORK10 BA2]|uniref:choice-of-anchor K domain-containing protein n=1 Tax=Leptothoe sp. PORK10 BA2 TaxID=3110254 RepID=UPI002B1FC262|nr:choice-of-anchor K domain-containing protein [Leptothoe sp. PORK10 BA2]MEA5463580.1 choice-of-anchor K domain-containing protein [Leptothoe sp. PORK10 BA2]
MVFVQFSTKVSMKAMRAANSSRATSVFTSISLRLLSIKFDLSRVKNTDPHKTTTKVMMNKSNIRAALAIAAVISTMGATPSYAFTLARTSAIFDNAQLSNGKTVGKAATNSDFANYEQSVINYTNNHDGNYVEYIEVNGVSQVRWGDGVYSNTNKNFEGGDKFNWDYGWYQTVDGNTSYQQGWHKDYTAKKSGLGFDGIDNLNLTVGQIFNLGTLKHYNNTIWGDGRDAKKTDFSLLLDFGDTGIGQQKFDFALNIDETNNRASSHAGGVCPYETTGTGCSDKITWDFALDSESSFEFKGKQYTLELVGFNDTANFDDGAVTDFISQESGTSEAHLFARLVKVRNDDDTEQIPEPGSLLGLGALGLLLSKARRQQKETVTADV